MNDSSVKLKRRKAAVLVCVLVVLLLVGLLSTQTIQTLLIVRRSDAGRREIRQAREMVKLGQLAIETGQIPENGQLDFSLNGKPASIEITEIPPPVNAADESSASEQIEGTPVIRYRVIAKYSASESKEVTATWETPE